MPWLPFVHEAKVGKIVLGGGFLAIFIRLENHKPEPNRKLDFNDSLFNCDYHSKVGQTGRASSTVHSPVPLLCPSTVHSPAIVVQR